MVASNGFQPGRKRRKDRVFGESRWRRRPHFSAEFAANSIRTTNGAVQQNSDTRAAA